MTWTSRYSEKWPRLTALFHLDNGVDTDVHENGRYETTFQEPTAEPFYKFYLHPDDIARGRSVSQYSMQAAGGADNNSSGSKSCNNANVRVFLGTVLLFSLAGVVAVAVTLAVLLSQPHGSSHNFSKIVDNKYSSELLTQKEKFLSNELCGLMKNMFKLDVNENRPLLDCSVSLLIQNGHMKVDFKVPATEKLMNEEIEKIKQNVLKNIKDIDIGLGVVSNTDDISIYKKNDQTSTTVQIILTTNKPVSGVTVATTDGDIVTNVDVEKELIEHKPLDTDTPLHVTHFGLDTTVSTESTTKESNTVSTTPTTTPPTLTTPNLTLSSTITTVGPLPDHTSINDLSFLSHFNKTVKDLIEDFHQKLGGTKQPLISSTVKPLLDTKEKSIFHEVNKDYFGATLDANDTFDFSGLQFLGSDLPERENTQNKSMPMYDGLSITKSPTVFDFSHPSPPSLRNDTETEVKLPLNDVSNNDFSKTLDNLYKNFDFDQWKSNKPTTTKMSSTESDARNISDENLLTRPKETPSTTKSNNIFDDNNIQSTTNLPKSTTTSSLQDLYQDFLWNFGARIHTTPRPEYPIHDHTSHDPLPVYHHPRHDLSHAPLHFTAKTIEPDLTLTEESHIDFGGMLSENVPSENITLKPLTKGTIAGQNSTTNSTSLNGSEKLSTHFFPLNDSFHGIGIQNSDGLLFDSKTASSSLSSVAILGKDPKHDHENRSETKQMFQTLSILDLNITPTRDLSSSYSELESQQRPNISKSRSNTAYEVSNGTHEKIVSDIISSQYLKTMMSSHNNITPLEENILPTGTVLFLQTENLHTRNASIYPSKSSQINPLVSENTTKLSEIVHHVSKEVKSLQLSVEGSATVTTTAVTTPIYSRQPLFSSNMEISTKTSINLQSSTKELIIDDIVFPKHLSFPEQKVVDHTLLRLPEMSVRSTNDGLFPVDFNKNHKLIDEGLQNSGMVSPKVLPSSDSLHFETSNFSKLSMSLPFDKFSIIPSLSSSYSTSSMEIPNYDVSKSFYFPDNYDALNDTHLIRNNLPSTLLPRQVNETKQYNVQPSYHTRFSNIQTLPSPIPLFEMSSSFFDKTNTNVNKITSFKSISSTLDYGHQQQSLYSAQSKASSAFMIITEKFQQQNTDYPDFSSVLEINETPLLNIFPSSSTERANILTASEVVPNYMNLTFPEQNWKIEINVSKSEQSKEISTGSLFESSSLPSIVNSKAHFPSEPSSSFLSSINQSFDVLEYQPLSRRSSFQTSIEPPKSDEIGVFQTNLPWSALDIIPTRSSAVINSLLTNQNKNLATSTNIMSSNADEMMISGSDNQSPLLYPSTVTDVIQTDTTTKAHYQTPSISVYHVTHEPIVYLTIDTRPVSEFSMHIKPTSRQTLQATLFRDRRKIDDLSLQGKQGLFKLKNISEKFILSTVETPTNLAITTSRPNLTSAQFADIRRRLARLRAAKLERLRRQQSMLSGLQSGKDGDFPLRREISGSNTANTFVGRGIDVNNGRSLQRPTRPPRFTGTTDNPRERVDRNRLFPGFNTDGRFNRNFFNNIRWNG